MGALEVGVVPRGVDDSTVTVGGLPLRVLRKGSGAPLVYLHDSLGNIGWPPLFDDLASSFDVVVPDLPGFGGSQCPTWARSTRDIAILTAQLLAIRSRRSPGHGARGLVVGPRSGWRR